MNFLGIIPARYSSSRFPGKPLADIGGKTMISRVFEQAKKALDKVIVATDDERIYEHVFSIKDGFAVMTSPEHASGTDRCMEALQVYEQRSGENFDVVINIQGDEPFIDPRQIELLKDVFIKDSGTQIATLIKKIDNYLDLADVNTAKVVFRKDHRALYFSRAAIPHIRGVEIERWINHHTFYKHIGIYAYKKDILRQITNLEHSIIEDAEKLEQNRWLDFGFEIKVAETDIDTISVDTQDDIQKIKNRGLF